MFLKKVKSKNNFLKKLNQKQTNKIKSKTLNKKKLNQKLIKVNKS